MRGGRGAGLCGGLCGPKRGTADLPRSPVMNSLHLAVVARNRVPNDITLARPVRGYARSQPIDGKSPKAAPLRMSEEALLRSLTENRYGAYAARVKCLIPWLL